MVEQQLGDQVVQHARGAGRRGGRGRGRRARPAARRGPRAARRRRGTRRRARRHSISRNWRDWKPRRRRQRVAELQEALGPHRLQHVEVPRAAAGRSPTRAQRRRGGLRAAGLRARRRARAQLVQDQLEPQLVGLVDDDEQQLVVRALGERALQRRAGRRSAGRRRTRCRRPAQARSLAVQRLVDERVGVARSARAAPGGSTSARTPRSALERLGVQRLHVRVLDLVAAVDLVGDQLGVVDDLDLGRRRAPRARSSPSSSPRYSATLLVAAPSGCAASSSTSPSGVGHHGRRGGRPGVAARAAVHVDDDLHAGATRAASIGGNSPGTRGAPPVADLALAAAGARPASRRSALRRSTITVDVGIVLVVGDELVVELVARAARVRRSRSSARDPTRRPRCRAASVIRPAARCRPPRSSAAALTTLSSLVELGQLGALARPAGRRRPRRTGRPRSGTS